MTVSGLAFTGSAAGNYTLMPPTLNADITPAPVTVFSGLTANKKIYDGTVTVTLSSNNVALSGVLSAHMLPL